MFPDCSKIQTLIVGRQSFTIRNLAILATLDQDILMARRTKKKLLRNGPAGPRVSVNSLAKR